MVDGGRVEEISRRSSQLTLLTELMDSLASCHRPQDYHVFFMHCLGPNRCLVYDLDTTLPFPTYFHKYVTETFRSDLALKPEHHR